MGLDSPRVSARPDSHFENSHMLEPNAAGRRGVAWMDLRRRRAIAGVLAMWLVAGACSGQDTGVTSTEPAVAATDIDSAPPSAPPTLTTTTLPPPPRCGNRSSRRQRNGRLRNLRSRRTSMSVMRRSGWNGPAPRISILMRCGTMSSSSLIHLSSVATIGSEGSPVERRSPSVGAGVHLIGLRSRPAIRRIFLHTVQ